MVRILLLICTFIYAVSLYSKDRSFVVVIDAGHGGKDYGAIRNNFKEKDINLAVSLALGNLIKRNMADVKVIYTRSSDVFVELDDRAEKANKARANLFISIHTNSTEAKKTSASGADTYILGLAKSEESLEVAKRENSVILLEHDYSSKYGGFDPNLPESYIIFEFMSNKYIEQSLNFAGFVQKEFKNRAKRIDRGVRQAGFLVLRKTSMPSVLIELGFINNPLEATFLGSKAGQNKIAESIYQAFKIYKIAFDKKNTGISDITNLETKNAITPRDTSKPGDINKLLSSRLQSNSEKNTKKAEKVEYRIQFLYSPTKLPTKSSRFKGLSPVGYYYENGYKYTYGSTENFNQIQEKLKKVQTKFKDAFIVRLKDGKRIVK